MSGGKKLIGQVHSPLSTGEELAENKSKLRDEILSARSDGIAMLVSPGFELITAAMPVSDPTSGARGLQRLVQVMPIDNCLNPGSPFVKPEGFHFFDDMDPEDAKLHRNLIESVMEQLRSARMAQSGLVPAGAGDVGKFGGGAKFG